MQIALAAAIVEILFDVTAPMWAESLVRVLHVTGFVRSSGDPIHIEQITAALNELVLAGRVERVRRHGSAAYKAIHSGSA